MDFLIAMDEIPLFANCLLHIWRAHIGLCTSTMWTQYYVDVIEKRLYLISHIW